ncbi:hypothetical protein KFK09_000794 [Dendrobium nobile]|uniref:Uncharacterized protein n=1 Tax=Dendrobium nobile TaxID=94219 RepID=A0A8T3C9Y4_DENNO|nr:hypothetical protein KFK09_000794 [Dendrobium nobile]
MICFLIVVVIDLLEIGYILRMPLLVNGNDVARAHLFEAIARGNLWWCVFYSVGPWCDSTLTPNWMAYAWLRSSWKPLPNTEPNGL